jgi:UDP-N-acetylglucosamine 2-epimerase (non-hydrolysing)
MKTAPVVRALAATGSGIEPMLVHTGQHYDEQMSAVFMDELGLAPDVWLEVGSGTHAEQTARAMVGVEQALVMRSPDLVVVPGDVNSTLAAAVAAVKLLIPVAHLEAGLRSFDETMPEEHNRKVADHLSRLLLAHSQSAVDNLVGEGISRERIELVGNTMIDSLFQHLPHALEAAPWRRFGLEERAFVLVTLHRPALVESDELLTKTMRSLAELSRDIPVLFPVHPRTRARLTALGLGDPNPRLHLVEPLGYHAFLGMEARAAAVLTDSGGVQEETSALGVPCFTLRSTTERPVTVELGTNTLLGLEPERITEIPRRVGRPTRRDPIPLWDGEAGPRVAAILADWVATERRSDELGR